MAPLNEPPPLDIRDPVGQLASGEPIAVAEKLTLRQLAAVLAAADIGAALVRRDDGAVGIVSERDVVRALADDADPDSVWSADVMTERLVTTGPHEPILRVALRMIEANVRHVGVREGDEITGIVSARDVFRVLAEHTLQRE
jgi:CBS domain-containing protein